MEHRSKTVIIPSKGICNTTPDAICSIGELIDCTNLTFAADAIRPVQNPTQLLSLPSGAKLSCVHSLNNGDTNYIATNGETLYSYSLDGKTITEHTPTNIGKVIISVKATGNTLVVVTKDSILYLLWKPSDNKYLPLGDSIPELDIAVQLTYLKGDSNFWQAQTSYTKTIANKELYSFNSSKNTVTVKPENLQAFADAIIGSYSELKNIIDKRGAFALPFFVRFALQLYDGTYYMPTNPILVLPNQNKSGFSFSANSNFIAVNSTFHGYLKYINSSDYSKWSDIVKKISVFVTKGIDTLDTDVYYSSTEYEDKTFTRKSDDSWTFLEQKPEESILDSLKSDAVFYHIADLPLTETDNYTLIHIKDNALTNLTTQQTLSNSISGEDYFSHCRLYTESVEIYNRRVNLIAPSRSIFKGFRRFSATVQKYTSDIDYTKITDYDIAVIIDTPDGKRVARTSIKASLEIISGKSWFYYPDPRATQVIINGNVLKLTEHPGLNGAYYLGGLATGNETPFSGTTSPTVKDESPETINNFIVQSEVDNPFVFFAKGYVRVGQGAILGMAALTTPLSQDAYKVATTLAFTTQGIWALQINSEGQYSSVTPPFSREVCNNPKSITMVDHGVFFSSPKGLMLIDDNGVHCVSSQLRGKNAKTNTTIGITALDPISDFLKGCTMAYDYRDSLLWITNGNYSFHWIFSMKTGTFSRMINSKKYISIVNSFPDCIMQDSNYQCYSMINKPDINTDSLSYSGSIITRPISLEPTTALKNICEAKFIDDIIDDNRDSRIILYIYASNDCRNWQYLPSLRGRGFKFYIFKFAFSAIKAYDTFTGITISYKTKQTDRIR